MGGLGSGVGEDTRGLEGAVKGANLRGLPTFFAAGSLDPTARHSAFPWPLLPPPLLPRKRSPPYPSLPPPSRARRSAERNSTRAAIRSLFRLRSCFTLVRR